MTKDYIKRQFSNFYNEVIKGKFARKSKVEELDIEWSQYWFDGAGGTGTTLHTDGVATDRLETSGLYLVIFPDELTATYNVVGITTTDRLNINSKCPFSIFVEDGDFLRVRLTKKAGGELLPTDDILKQVQIILVNNLNPDCDIAIAPHDALLDKKKKANIVLDGQNDTRILASLFGCYHSINVLLYDGTYNINEMWTHSSTAKIALSFNDWGFDNKTRRYITVRGEHKSTPQTINAVKFVISQSLHESLSSSEMNYFIIGTPYSYGMSQIQRMAVSCDLRNINIIGYKYDKPITYVDTTRCLSTMLESVNVRSWAEHIGDYLPFDDTPNERCCGIRVGRGSTYGIQNYVKHLNVWYCGIGIACSGEHFIFEDVKTHHDYIGFMFGDRYTVGKLEHPNIMLGCSIEGCYRLMVLTKNAIKVAQDRTSDEPISTLVVIGLSTEPVWSIPTNEIEGDVTSQITLPIDEIVRGAWRGRIEMDWVNDSIFTQGSGTKFEKTIYHS